MPGGWLSGVMSPENIDVWYNLADAINKWIRFSCNTIAIGESKKTTTV